MPGFPVVVPGLRRGNFCSLADLAARFTAFIDYFNQTMAKPFRWTH
jgi:hypothetical protein